MEDFIQQIFFQPLKIVGWNVRFNNNLKNLFFYVETCLYSHNFQIKIHTAHIYFIFGYS